jgi:predicted O-linked N-acetylglucosamine transferase (SPINDLY family)
LHNNLGNAYRESGDHVKAEASYRKAIAIEPGYAMAHNNLGNLLLENKRTNEAITSLGKATSLHPGYAIAHYNLGNALKFQGSLEEALASYRKALSLDPRNSSAHSILLFLMHYFAQYSGKDIYLESLRWARQHADILLPARQVYANSRDLGRKLRIGYMSPDFRTHSVAYFIEPVIQAHNRNNVAVYCYANVKKPDPTTQRLQEEADYWRNIFGLSDAAVADRIRNDAIDILVDLAGHTPKNRLLVFARRPAPVQVTWLGYPNTTGMAAMDYRLTDAIADPAGAADTLHSEELTRLEHGFLCYQPDASAPEVAPAPFLKHGYVTFGSFNNIAKVTPEVIKLWAEILQRTPRSRLLIKSKPLADPDNRKRFQRLFVERGIAADRLELHGWLPTKEGHLELYKRIDIGLDPFPYNGTTTTCEALWMGVPVVTLLGERHSGRVGASIMHWAGLDELVAESPEKYQDLAVSMAKDYGGMQNLRKGLRKQVRQSRLMDRQNFTDILEATYRNIWAKWCVA